MKLKADSRFTAITIMIIIFVALNINYALDNGLHATAINTYKWITAICLFVGLFGIICTIISIITGKFSKSNLVYIIIILIGCLYIPYPLNIGSTQIGDLYEKTEYSEMYNVFMSEQPKDAGKRTVYKLPAKITRTGDAPTYRVYRIYFNNGGYLTFNEINGEAFPGKEAKVMDEHGNTYYVTLTRTKINN